MLLIDLDPSIHEGLHSIRPSRHLDVKECQRTLTRLILAFVSYLINANSDIFATAANQRVDKIKVRVCKKRCCSELVGQ